MSFHLQRVTQFGEFMPDDSTKKLSMKEESGLNSQLMFDMNETSCNNYTDSKSHILHSLFQQLKLILFSKVL